MPSRRYRRLDEPLVSLWERSFPCSGIIYLHYIAWTIFLVTWGVTWDRRLVLANRFNLKSAVSKESLFGRTSEIRKQCRETFASRKGSSSML